MVTLERTLGPSVDLTRSPSAIAPMKLDNRAFSPRSSVAYHISPDSND